MPEPLPFPLEGKEEEFKFPAETHLHLAALPFAGVQKPLSEAERVAVIFWGPPNSGKTTGCSQYVLKHYPTDVLNSMVPVSYDEPILRPCTGALLNIPAYAEIYAAQEKIAKACGRPDRDLLTETYRTYRWDSQRVRSLTLNRAVVEGYHVCVDTTSSSSGIYKMIEALRKLGYTKIDIIGMVAPLAVAVPRSEERLRIVEPDEVFSKRDGAFRTFGGLVERADNLVLLNNAVNGQSPEFVLRAKEGAVVENRLLAVRHIAAYVATEQDYCARHPVGQGFAEKLAESGISFVDVLHAPVVAVRKAAELGSSWLKPR